MRESGKRLRAGSAAARQALQAARGARAGHRPVFALRRCDDARFELQLEVDGVLRCWSLPHAPSLRAGEQGPAYACGERMVAADAIAAPFAGASDVVDHGIWLSAGDPRRALARGRLEFELQGAQLQGGWRLVRGADGRRRGWLLQKRADAYGYDRPGAPRRPAIVVMDGAGPVERVRRLAMAAPGAQPFAAGTPFVPQLPVPAVSAPHGPGWLHEVKWAGYRLLAAVDGDAIVLRSRRGVDWTAEYPEIVAALRQLHVQHARLDGELVAIDAHGRADASALQRILAGELATPLRYVVFDVPAVAGVDLRATPLLARKKILGELLGPSAPPVLAVSEHVIGRGERMLATSMAEGLEGIVCKRVDAPYTAGPSPDWITIAHGCSGDFVVVGHTRARGGGLDALLLAEDDGGALRYAGHLRAGLDAIARTALSAHLHGLARAQPPFAVPAAARTLRGGVQWVEPKLIVEVEQGERSATGLLRRSRYLRLRVDKTPEDLRMPRQGNVAITHPERMVYPAEGISKGEVAAYYRAVAQWLLRDASERPLSLLRCPDGVADQCFYQKHHNPAFGAHVHAVGIVEKDGDRAEYPWIDTAEGLLELVQMNALEFHVWGARADDPELPDRLVFDLDPGEGVRWSAVTRAARDVRDLLAADHLRSWLRLSGGKGLHVVAPIRRGPSWQQVKAYCERIADTLVLQHPDRYVSTASKSERAGRIFIDWLRNARGSTSIASWSLRARSGAAVAMPIRWEELGRTRRGDEYDLSRALRRAAALLRDPWEGMAGSTQKLPAL